MTAQPTKPLLKRGVTIQLKDGSTIVLSREVASKLNVVRSPLEYLLNVEGRTEDEAYQTVIPVDYYPAQNIRQYLKLMERIDKREELADIRLSQLFGLLLDAMYMGNETGYTNLADYIIATVYASREMGDNVKAEIRRIYLAGPPEPKRLLIQRRLAELNQTLTLKNVRNLHVTRMFSESRNVNVNTAIDNQGKILLLYSDLKPRSRYGKHKSIAYYDEVSPGREKLINSLLSRSNVEEMRVGGVIKQGIITVGEIRMKSKWMDSRNLIKYPSDQSEGRQLITRIGQSAVWQVSPYGSKLLTSDWNNTIKIYNLTDNSLVFEHKAHKHYLGDSAFRFESYVMGNWGHYLVLIYSSDDQDEGTLIELFAIDKTTSAGGQSIEGNKLLFEILIPIWTEDKEIAIDPYRRLVYIVYHSAQSQSVKVLLPGNSGYNVSIILVINFKGQVLHRYANREFAEFEFYVTVRQVLTHEAEYWSGEDEPLFGMTKEDLQYIEPQPNYTEIGDMAPIKLPAYEVWPNASTNSYQSYVSREPDSDNLWIRDSTDGFKVLALVKKNIGGFSKAVSSANGDYIVTIENRAVDDYNLSVMQTVLYTDDEVKIIRNILEGEKTT